MDAWALESRQSLGSNQAGFVSKGIGVARLSVWSFRSGLYRLEQYFATVIAKDYLSNPPTPYFEPGSRPVHPADRLI